MVCLKRLNKDSEELAIALYFSRPELRADPRNHCVPILDTFDDDYDRTTAYLVMPFLRDMDDPPFELVKDVVEFADQVFEVHFHRASIGRNDTDYTPIGPGIHA